MLSSPFPCKDLNFLVLYILFINFELFINVYSLKIRSLQHLDHLQRIRDSWQLFLVFYHSFPLFFISFVFFLLLHVNFFLRFRTDGRHRHRVLASLHLRKTQSTEISLGVQDTYLLNTHIYLYKYTTAVYCSCMHLQ